MKKIFLTLSLVLAFSLTSCGSEEAGETKTEATTVAQSTEKQTEASTENSGNEYDEIIDNMAIGIFEKSVDSYITQCSIVELGSRRIHVSVSDYPGALPLAADYIARIVKQSEKYKGSTIVISQEDGNGNVTEWESDDCEVGTFRSSTSDPKFDVSINDLLGSSEESTESASTENASSVGESNALKQALSYLDYSAFSASGLKDQLMFEGYTEEEAQFGVDNCGADWKEQAVLKAKDYLDYSAFSESGLKDQLEYEGFTEEEAAYGVEKCGGDWMEQAEKKAKDYMDYSSFSKQGLIDQLLYEGFTQEQAEHGAAAVGY